MLVAAILKGILTTILLVVIYSWLNGNRILPDKEECKEAAEGSYGILIGFPILMFRKLLNFLMGAKQNGWLSAIVAGILAGAVKYFTPRLTPATQWWAPVMLVTMVGLMAHVAHLIYRWCRMVSARLAEFLPFITALAVIRFCYYRLLQETAVATSALWDKNPFWDSVFGRFLPFLVTALTISIPIVRGLLSMAEANRKYAAKEDTPRDDKRGARADAERYSAWATIIGIVTFLVIALHIWILIDWSTGSSDSARNNSNSGAIQVTPSPDDASKKAAEEEERKQRELARLADESIKAMFLNPEEIRESEAKNYYGKFGGDGLMTNTWLGMTGAKQKAYKKVLGKEIFTGVEFPVDIALDEAGYVGDHEGTYTNSELEEIREWIESKKVNGKLSEREQDLAKEWVITRILRDPIYGHMWAQAFAELHSVSGKSLAELLPWLAKFVAEWEDGKRLIAYSATYGNREGFYVHPDYMPIGMALATVFEKLIVVGVQEPKAVHFGMEYISEDTTQMTTVKAEGTESLAAIVFVADVKDQQCLKEKIGLNLYDGRAEIILPPVEVVVPQTTTAAPTTPASTTPVPTTPVPTTPVPTTPAPTTPTPTDPTTQPYTKDISKGVTDPAKATQPVDTTGPGTRNTESSLTPPSTAYPQPTEPPTTSVLTTEYVEPTLPTHEEETTAVPPTTVDSRESSEIWSQDPTEPPVYYSDPASPTTGQQTDPEPSWGGPSD